MGACSDNREEPQLGGSLCVNQLTEELSRTYHVLDWINTTLSFPSPVVCLRFNIFPESDNGVKLFVTRSIEPVVNKRIIVRIHTVHAKM